MTPAADFGWLKEINLWQVAVTIIAIWIVIRLLVRFWPWLRKVMELTAALAQLPDFIARTDRTLTDQTATLAAQDRKIEEIHHEVNYNNGSSVKDAVSRVELGVKGLYDRAGLADEAGAARDVEILRTNDAILELREDLEHTRPVVAKRRTTKPKEQA